MERNRLELLIGTGNKGKASEIQLALNDLPLLFRFVEEFPQLQVAEETGTSYLDNALIKAMAYARQSGVWVLADDSGLEVTALDGAPGIKSARFGGNGLADSERTELLISQLKSVEPGKRHAQFVCVIVIAEPSGRIVTTAEGICQGTIAGSPLGDEGFGYDPVFIPDGYNLTFGQLSSTIKAKISHRGKALATIRQFLRAHLAELKPF